MKRLLFALCLMLPLVFTACDDDDDLPNVNFDVEFSNAVQDGGVVYVVRGQTLTIDGITVTNNESGKGAMITAASYFWDSYPLGTSVIAPYGFNINTTEQTPLGRHDLTIECPLYAEDKASSMVMIMFDVCVVADEADLPDVSTTPDATHVKGSAKVTQ